MGAAGIEYNDACLVAGSDGLREAAGRGWLASSLSVDVPYSRSALINNAMRYTYYIYLFK